MSLDVADMDHDGDVDVVVGEHNLNDPANAQLLLFKNADGSGGSWTQQIIYTGDEHHDGAQIVDLDNDGDLDIISIGWNNTNVLWYENKTTEPGGVPIQFGSFTGQRISQHAVRLGWTTISEIDNYGFFVQNRRAGERENGEWGDVPNSFVAGHGTTNEPHDYSFTDNVAPSGNLQYRLKQLDLDGTVHFTEPITVSSLTSVEEIAPTEFSLEQNYPNPFNPSTTIKFSIPSVGAEPARTASAGGHVQPVQLRVYDILGREVATLVNENLQTGSYEVTFSANGLTSGVYFLQMNAGGRTFIKKMLLVR
jgi:hypothetical protein